MRIIPFQELVMGLGGKDEAGKILASFSIGINPDVENFLHNKSRSPMQPDPILQSMRK